VTTVTAQRFREFKMPDVGEGLTEAEILKWYVKPGDPVTDGQVVCEVETAKAAVELPIPFDGVVHELHFGEGDTVDVARARQGTRAGGAEAAAGAGRLRRRRVLDQAPPAQEGRCAGPGQGRS
jgi:pyruvate dehydrogenase E2 component (dihydrolipoamide acetyltransferase)